MSTERFLTLHGPNSTTMMRVSEIIVVSRGATKTTVGLSSGEVVTFDHPDGHEDTFDAISKALVDYTADTKGSLTVDRLPD